jgi:pimeloyl-ACP methyl ester carboxylesterase
VVTETDLTLADGRTLHFYDTDPKSTDRPVVWLHGTPNLGSPPRPLLPAAAERGLRWLSYDRPGYGGSSAHEGRTVASAADDVQAIADELGLQQFAVMGHSGGGPHALACAALLPDRVVGAVCVAGLAPPTAAGLSWFAGMAPGGAAELRAARQGRAALEACLTASEFDPAMFTPEDRAALVGPWSWLAEVAERATDAGLDGMLDDDLAFAADWGFELASIHRPVLFLHGGRDRVVPIAHGAWLAGQIRLAELWLQPTDGHISVLGSGVAALDWIRKQA